MFNKKAAVILLFLMVVFISLSSVAFARELDIQQMVQKPLAVNRLVKAGMPSREVGKITRALNRGKVSARAFNETLRQTPYLVEKMGDVTKVGEFVTRQVEDGFRGEKLARRIHARMRQHGIPSGGREKPGPPPVAKEFIPPAAQEAIKRARPEKPDRDDRPAVQPAPSGPQSQPARPGGGMPGDGRPGRRP